MGARALHDSWGRGGTGQGCQWDVGVRSLVREVAGWLGELRVTNWPVRGKRVGRKWRNGLDLRRGFSVHRFAGCLYIALFQLCI